MFINKCNCCKVTESKPCGASTSSGGEGETINIHATSDKGGVIYFAADAYLVPDRFVIEIDNNIVIDTGVISGRKNYFFIKPAGINEIKVTVYGPYDTVWDYLLCCPVVETCNRLNGSNPVLETRLPTSYVDLPSRLPECEESSCFSVDSTKNRIKRLGQCLFTTGYNCCKDCAPLPQQPDINKCCKNNADHTDDNPSLCCQNDCCYTYNRTGGISVNPYTAGKFVDNGFCCPDDLPYCRECETDEYIRSLVTGDWDSRGPKTEAKEKSCRDEDIPFMEPFTDFDFGCYGIPHTYTFEVPEDECVVLISFVMSQSALISLEDLFVITELNVTINGENYDYQSIARTGYLTQIYICKPRGQTQLEIVLNSLSVIYVDRSASSRRYDDLQNTCITPETSTFQSSLNVSILSITNGCPCTISTLGNNPLP